MEHGEVAKNVPAAWLFAGGQKAKLVTKLVTKHGGRSAGVVMLSHVLGPGSGFGAALGWVWGAGRALGHFAPKWSQTYVAFQVAEARSGDAEYWGHLGDHWAGTRNGEVLSFFNISP